MADKTDDLIISISKDLTTVRRSLKKLEADISASSTNVRQQFDKMGKGIDTSMMTAMQARVNAMVGVGVKASKEWTGALAQQGAEMEKLRARFSPMFATVTSYKNSIGEIRQAHALGAISSDEMTSAITRERQAALASIAAIKGRNAALSATPKQGSSGAGSFQTANIAAQFQDVAVTTAMGMSPIQIALQQGTQLSAVLNTMENPVKGLAAAFMSVINPVSLVTIGVIAAGAALFQYMTAAGDGSKSVDEILKRHEENIRRLGPAYEAAMKAQQKYVAESPALTAGRLADDAADALKARLKDSGKSVAKIYAELFKEQSDGTAAGGIGGLIPSRFEAARKAIQAFEASVSSGSPKVREFQEEIAKLADAGQLTKTAASELRGFTDEALKTEDGLKGVSGEVDYVGTALEKLQSAINSTTTGAARKELTDLVDQTIKNDKSLAELAKSIDVLSGKYPDMAATIRELGGVVVEALKAKAALDQLTLAQGRDFSQSFKAGEKGGRLGSPSLEDLKAQNEVLYAEQLKFVMRWDKDFRDKLASSNKTINRENKPKKDRAAERDANAYRDLVKSADDRIEQMQLEVLMVGKTGAAADAYRMKLELLQKATDKGRTIDEKQRAELEAKAETYGKLAEKVAALALEEELRFERSQMFKNPTEQRVSSQLRNAGLDENSARGQFLASQIRMNEQLAISSELTKELASGFLNDLKNGVGVMEALANAAGKLGDKLLDMAMDQAIQGLFGNLMGTLGGGLGGLGSRSAQFAASGGIGLFADGGKVTGPGSGTSDSILARLSNGEFVVNAEAANKHRTLLEAINSGMIPGFSAGGSVGTPMISVPTIQVPRIPSAASVGEMSGMGGGSRDSTVNINVDVTGARGNSEIQEMVNRGVSQGIDRFQQSSNFAVIVGRAAGRAGSRNVLGR